MLLIILLKREAQEALWGAQAEGMEVHSKAYLTAHFLSNMKILT